MPSNRYIWCLCAFVLFVSPLAIAVNDSRVNPSQFTPKLEWVRTYGNGYGDEARFAVIDDTGYIYISADAYSFNKSAPSRLLKYSPNGNLMWNISTYGHGAAVTFNCAIGKSGSVYVFGITQTNISKKISPVVLKYDSMGNYVSTWFWNNSHFYTGGPGIDVDSNENVYLSGAIGSLGLPDVYLLKFNNSGKTEWNTTWGGLYDDSVTDMKISSSDNIYLGGFKNDTSIDDNKLLLLKYNSTGYQQWFRTYGSGGFYGYGIAVSSLEEIFLVGSNPNGHAQLLKYDSMGNLKWNRDPACSEDFWGVDTSQDGNFVYATGHITGGPLSLVKYDKDGNFIWNISWHSRTDGLGYSLGNDVAVNASGEIYVVGKTVDPPGDPNSKAVILKFVEVSVPEFVTVILPTITLTALFIIVTKIRKRKRDRYERNY